MDDVFGPIIHAYSRAEALDDGELVDVSETARDAGVGYPCALTREAWESTVGWDSGDTERTSTPQDESGRLWDVLWMYSLAARRSNATDRLEFDVYVVPRDEGGAPRRRTLKAVVGPGDTPDPVVTIMLPEES
jgi:hypothetical protein